uniref:Uncharacterized protein n=1 Tax=Romanomermis culicivorax TaxID=13658 RepID=A0A915JB31_ROMCU
MRFPTERDGSSTARNGQPENLLSIAKNDCSFVENGRF